MDQDQKDSFERLLKRELAADQFVGNDCPDENHIAAYVEKRLNSGQRTRVDQHLLQCARCQKELLFLLKSSDESSTRAGSSLEIIRTVSSWFQWLKPTLWKPVFAILIVAVVSSFLGYRLFMQQTPVSVIRSERAAESMQKEPLLALDLPAPDTPPPGTPAPPAPLQDEKQPDRGAETKATAPRPDSSETAKDNQFKEGRSSDTANQRYAQQTGGPDKRSSQPTDQAQVSSVAKDSTLNTPSEDVHHRKDGEAKERALSGSVAANKPAVAGITDESSRRQTQANSERDEVYRTTPPAKNAPRSEMATDNEREAADQFAKKQKMEDGAAKADGMVNGSLREPTSKVEIAGKTFDLREQVWTDREITKEDSVHAILIAVPSPEFQRLRPALRQFTDIVSRPEDVLIKINQQVYRLRKSHLSSNP